LVYLQYMFSNIYELKTFKLQVFFLYLFFFPLRGSPQSRYDFEMILPDPWVKLTDLLHVFKYSVAWTSIFLYLNFH
jgi:hypothetical protein